MCRRPSLLAFLAVALLAPAAHADVPQLFSLQGVLRDKSGALQSSAVKVTLKLFAAEVSNDPPLATVTVPTVPVLNGLFTVNVPLSPELTAAFNRSPVWLEMTIGDNDTFPRQQVTPDVYALLCGTADGLSSAAIVDGKQLAPASVPVTALAPSLPGWQSLTSSLKTPWHLYTATAETPGDTGYTPAAAYLDPFGVVHLRGLLSAASDNKTPNPAGGNSVAFILPEGMRPAKHWLLQGMSYDAPTGGAAELHTTRIDVQADGTVTLNVAGGRSVVWTSIDGISFTLN
jgi:hypothetical protein